MYTEHQYIRTVRVHVHVRIFTQLTSCMPPTGVPVVGAVCAQTGSNGLTKHNTACMEKMKTSTNNYSLTRYPEGQLPGGACI